MEQYSEYLMWVKSKNSILINTHSWEEEAFAEDSRGPLGGFVWPPRSYSCTFCKREFRSAQALGGHMNVHRRERAKLKQSLNDPHQNPKSLGQESTIFCSSSDGVETNLYLGFDGCEDEEVMNCKRQKMMTVFVEGQVDLELRLAS